MKAGWTRSLIIVSILALSFGVAGPVLAQECSAMDVTCVTDDVVDDLQDTTGDTTEAVTGTVEPVVEDTLDEVDRILGGGNEEPPPGGGGGGGDGGGGGSGEGGSADDPLSQRSGVSFGLQASITSSATLAGDPRAQLDPGTTLRERFGTALAGAAESLVVVAVLLGIAIAFVLMQNRIDRADPRLALAPIESDLVRFT